MLYWTDAVSGCGQGWVWSVNGCGNSLLVQFHNNFIDTITYKIIFKFINNATLYYTVAMVMCVSMVTRSDTVWERQVKGKKKNRFTPVEVALSLLLENHYQQGTNGVVPIPELEGTKVDFTDQEHVSR